MEKRLLVNELYQYLLGLQNTLRERGAIKLADKVQFAARFASGSPSELYTEAEDALKTVLREQKDILSKPELGELRQKIVGIDTEFRLIGGA